MVKKLPGGHRERNHRLRRRVKPLQGWGGVQCHGGSSKAAGLQRLLVVLVGEPFKEIGAQPSGGGAGQQNHKVSQVVSIF